MFCLLANAQSILVLAILDHPITTDLKINLQLFKDTVRGQCF